MIITKKSGDSSVSPASGESSDGILGSHPVSTGVGAVAGGAAAGLAVGTVAGPLGVLAGAALGAVVGGITGKSVAEVVNPSFEDAYWRDRHIKQAFANGRSYEDFGHGYRTGYEGYQKFGADGASFQDHEPELKKFYEDGSHKLAWGEVRPATQAAWLRVQERAQKKSLKG